MLSLSERERLWPYLCSTLRTFQPSSTPLLTRAFCASVDTAARMAAPSARCRALLPTTTVGRLADASTWRERGGGERGKTERERERQREIQR